MLIYPLYLSVLSFIVAVLNLALNKRPIDNFLIKLWARGTCMMFGVRVHVEGLHNIPQKMGCIYVFNHTSYFDIWAMSGYLPSFRFGAKIELFKIPIFGWAIRRVGVLPINRERRESVFQVYSEAKNRIMNGDRFALSPEGTRMDKEELGPFKSGPFILAVQCEAPLVPVIIRNASRVMPKDSFLPNWNSLSDDIYLQVLPPYETKGRSLDEKKDIMNDVHKIMDEQLKKSVTK